MVYTRHKVPYTDRFAGMQDKHFTGTPVIVNIINNEELLLWQPITTQLNHANILYVVKLKEFKFN